MSHAMRVTGAIGTALVVLSLVLVACGGGGAGSRTVPGPSAASSHRKPSANRSRPRSKGAKKHLAPAPPCRARDLVVWHSGDGGGAMSTFYTTFTVTNLSGHACRVAGTPRLEALDVGDRQMGPAAHPGGMPTESRRRSVRIPAHGDAAFRASWPENAYAAGECRPRTVAGYRVFLPGSQMARFVPFPGPERCSNPNAERAFSVGRLEEPDGPRGGGRATAPVLITTRPGERLPRCPASKLLVSLGVDAFAGVGGGHSFTRLDVINLSGRPCELSATHAWSRSATRDGRSARRREAARGWSPSAAPGDGSRSRDCGPTGPPSSCSRSPIQVTTVAASAAGSRLPASASPSPARRGRRPCRCHSVAALIAWSAALSSRSAHSNEAARMRWSAARGGLSRP